MSSKWTFTARPMSMRRRVQPSRSASSTALSRVRSVVPKQGHGDGDDIRGGTAQKAHGHHGDEHRQRGVRPPDRPTTAVLARVCSSRFFQSQRRDAQGSRRTGRPAPAHPPE